MSEQDRQPVLLIGEDGSRTRMLVREIRMQYLLPRPLENRASVLPEHIGDDRPRRFVLSDRRTVEGEPIYEEQGVSEQDYRESASLPSRTA